MSTLLEEIHTQIKINFNLFGISVYDIESKMEYNELIEYFEFMCTTKKFTLKEKLNSDIELLLIYDSEIDGKQLTKEIINIEELILSLPAYISHKILLNLYTNQKLYLNLKTI